MKSAYWTRKLQEAESDLDAATRLSDVNAAARRAMLAKAELKRLEQKAPTRRESGAAAPAAPKRLVSLVDLEPRRYQVLDHPIGQFVGAQYQARCSFKSRRRNPRLRGHREVVAAASVNPENSVTALGESV